MYRFNEQKMFYDSADGMGIVICFTTGVYYSLNAAGTAVFEQLTAGADPKALAAELAKMEGCPADMENRVLRFAEMLEEKEILVSDGAPFTPAEAFPAAAAAEGFDLTADEYHEVQDLILADPIHDVDPNLGWPILKKDDEH